MTESNEDPSREKDALYEYGKKALLDATEVIKNFITLMIPLTTGMITVYFALLKFLNIETATELANTTIKTWDILMPELLFIASLVAFIGASFPFPRKIAIGNIPNIRNYRRSTIKWKYSWMVTASGLFIAGIVNMVTIVVNIIGL